MFIYLKKLPLVSKVDKYLLDIENSFSSYIFYYFIL